jgi:hypothetical protein
MKPSQIRVFDGLRISTDHVNHLQGAFTSGLEDLRQILGLGKPQSGLEVNIQDDGSAVIQPGVAFDFQKNRLACDDPLNLKLTFAAEDKSKYVCLKYEQVEDGAVEGHPTMLWDSCSALVRDALPDPTENLVTLAEVVKDTEGKLHVRRPYECDRRRPATEVTAVQPDSPVGSGPNAAAPDTTPTASPTAVIPAAGSTAADPGATGGPPAPDSGGASNAPIALDTSTAASPAPQVLFRQGVAQLMSDPAAGSYLRSVLAPALRKKLGADPIELSFSLAQIDLTPDLHVSGFATQCILSGDLIFPASGDTPQLQHHFECVGNGEATVGAGSLAQFAACVANMHPVPATAGTSWSGAELTVRGVDEFAFARWSGAPDGARPPFPQDVLAGLQLLVQLAPAAQGFQLSVKLLWSGTIQEQSLQGLETQDIGFTWQALFGWKALGY